MTFSLMFAAIDFVVLHHLTLLDAGTVQGLMLGEAFVENVDLASPVGNAYSEFMSSGKATTAAVSFFLGYVFRTITS
jgi:hypothetical protein